MSEYNRCFRVDFDLAGLLELLDSICTFERPSKSRVVGNKDVVQWLLG